jgi:hypothetical protein
MMVSKNRDSWAAARLCLQWQLSKPPMVRAPSMQQAKPIDLQPQHNDQHNGKCPPPSPSSCLVESLRHEVGSQLAGADTAAKPSSCEHFMAPKIPHTTAHTLNSSPPTTTMKSMGPQNNLVWMYTPTQPLQAPLTILVSGPGLLPQSLAMQCRPRPLPMSFVQERLRKTPMVRALSMQPAKPISLQTSSAAVNAVRACRLSQLQP